MWIKSKKFKLHLKKWTNTYKTNLNKEVGPSVFLIISEFKCKVGPANEKEKIIVKKV